MSNAQPNPGYTVLNDAPCGEVATIGATGLGRSGTTMLARTLFEIGLPMGDRLTPRTCEDKVIQKQLKARDHDAFADLCSSRSAQTPRWGFKCPALRNQMQDCVPLMQGARFVVVFRDLLAVALRNNLSMGREQLDALERAEQGYRRLVQEVQRLEAPVLLLSYEKALQHPETLVTTLADFSGLPVSPERAAEIAASTIRNADPRYQGTQAG